ncbi:MAG: hypothetical protein ACLU80_02220 [Dorea sp.]
MEIRMEKCKELKQKPDQKHLGFGKYMNYMFVMDWTKSRDGRMQQSYHTPINRTAMVLHYAQEAFEGTESLPHWQKERSSCSARR